LLDQVGFEDPPAARIMELLSAEAKIDEPSARLFVEQAIDLLCIQLLRKHAAFRFHFCTTFRLATGKTPHEWLVIQRIDMARKLLEDRVLNIIEVGLEVGYGTPPAFTTAFRKIVGCTPTDFRRRL
jgi:AraC family transcriptional regulator